MVRSRIRPVIRCSAVFDLSRSHDSVDDLNAFGAVSGVDCWDTIRTLFVGSTEIFFHSRVATLDVPVAAMYVTTAAVALAAERDCRMAWCLGPVYGLATATKLNAPFLDVV